MATGVRIFFAIILLGFFVGCGGTSSGPESRSADSEPASIERSIADVGLGTESATVIDIMGTPKDRSLLSLDRPNQSQIEIWFYRDSHGTGWDVYLRDGVVIRLENAL